MATARNPSRGKRDTRRDAGGFVALPWSVLDSPAYLGLSVHAKALLVEVARQFHSDDNGRMLLSRAYLAPRGWKSSDMIMKAKRELLAAGLIFETAKGMRPNKASWFAVTWRALDNIPGFDFGAEHFERGAYRKNAPLKNASLRPPHGTEKAPIAPPHGTETPAAVPPHGAIRPVFAPLSVPPHGHPLEVAISGAGIAGSPLDPDPAGKDEKAGAPLEKASAADRAPKPPTCQHPTCDTLVLAGRDFCARHRKHPASLWTDGARVSP